MGYAQAHRQTINYCLYNKMQLLGGLCRPKVVRLKAKAVILDTAVGHISHKIHLPGWLLKKAKITSAVILSAAKNIGFTSTSDLSLRSG
jgi:hypothetical protein